MPDIVLEVKGKWLLDEEKKTWDGFNNILIGADSKCPHRRGRRNMSPKGAVDQEEMEHSLGRRTIFSQPALKVTALIQVCYRTLRVVCKSENMPDVILRNNRTIRNA